MAKEVAHPKNTGGGGFGFEDKVVAYYFACILTDQPPLDARFGTIQRIDFQVRVDGWHLDDALLTLEGPSGKHRCGMSIKSNHQFANSGSAPADFVTTAWETFFDRTKVRFDPTADVLALATTPLNPDLNSQIHELLMWARAQDSKDLVRRVDAEGYGHEIKRSTLASFTCPDSLAKQQGISSVPTGDLLKCVQHLAFDFEIEPSHDLERAIALCRTAMASGELTDARNLWEALCILARDNRPVSGYFDLPRLLDALRGRFQLKAYPHYVQDWEKLRQVTRDSLEQVPHLIGGKVLLPRTSDLQRICATQGHFIALVGPSGCGKTALAKMIAKNCQANEIVLWFNAVSFDVPDFSTFENHLRLQHPLRKLFSACPSATAMVVVDGLDRVFDARVFANISAFFKKLSAAEGGLVWRIILTSQPEEWERLQQGLSQVNFRVGWSIVEIDPPNNLEPVWESFPKLHALTHRPELKALLLSPNVLDLLATKIDAVDPEKWVGETDLIDWMWQSRIAKPPHAAIRAAFVGTVAEKQGDAMKSELSLRDFQIADQQPVDELVQDRICAVREGRIRFHHDRYGDWARQRVLLSHLDELNHYLASRLSSPSWYPAIRLLGLHLLEQEKGIGRWKALFNSATSEDESSPSLLQDLLLDAVIFAAAPGPLLERLWPELQYNHGFWLKRLLKRFLHVATLPHPIIQQFLPELAVEAATILRVPYLPYWLPMLRFVAAHADEMVGMVPRQLAEIIVCWLRQGDVNWPLRREIAAIGLQVGRSMLDSIREKNVAYSEDDFVKTCFRAALAGAKELPDEVAAFALDAAERTTEGRSRPTHITTRSRHLGTSTREIPPPWPDGPFSRISKAFATEVLGDMSAIMPLCTFRPVIAREVILAALIEEPTTPSPYVDRSTLQRHQLGITDNLRWFPPFYTRGPFLIFLKIQPQEGLELILRLVNFTFERWASIQMERDQLVPEVKVSFFGGERSLIGERDAYIAYTDNAQWPHAVICALMALEKWLYDEIDEGKEVEAAIETILQKGNSVAFAGLLIAVGCKKPELFKGVLRPFLGVPEFHHWEMVRGINRHVQGQMIGWFREPGLARMANEWHSMPHRQRGMDTWAWELFLRDEEVQEFLTAQSHVWKNREATEADPQMAHLLKQLAPKFRIENWTAGQHPEHGNVILYQPPEELRKENEEAAKKIAAQQLLITLPVQCSQLLTAGTPLPADQIEAFWKQLQQAADTQVDIEDEDGLLRVENAVCGGIAVLFSLHEDWLNANPDKKATCVTTIIEVLNNPPPRPRMEFEGDVSDWDWRTFCARAVGVLWAEAPQSPELRGLVASLATSHKYKTVQVLFETLSKRRTQLGEAFVELQDFLFDFARARRAWNYTQHSEHPFDINAWIGREIKAFAERTRSRRKFPWRDIAEPNPINGEDGEVLPDKDKPPLPKVDLELIQAAYAWLPALAAATNEQDRNFWLNFWIYAQEVSIDVAQDKDGDHSFPYDWDQWTIRRIAGLIVESKSSVEREGFWKPFLELGATAHHWTEYFLEDWFLIGLGRGEPNGSFVQEWQKMIIFAQTALSWANEQDSSHEVSRLWIKLMGLEHWNIWSENHRPIIGGMRGLYEAWARRFLQESDSIAAFSRFLENPAAEDLVFDGLIWIREAAPRLNRHGRYGEINEVLASLLVKTWNRYEQKLRNHPEAFAAFKAILQSLAEVQNPVALELTDRMK